MSNIAKKVVDLIIVEPPKDERTLVQEYQTKIDLWGDRLKNMQEWYFEQHFDSASTDVMEIMKMRKFLTGFLKTRLDWIQKMPDSETRKQYLRVLPPFPQAGGIKTMLIHFFQVEDTDDKKGLKYKEVTRDEREVRILWDIYKLRKTIESIVVLEKAVKGDNPFPSIYAVEDRIQKLDDLKTVFKLLYQMCIHPKFQKELYQDISPKIIQPDVLLQRREQGINLVYPHVIDKFDYRNHFFFVYYSSGMKAKIAGKVKEFKYNYLDFEIIKQEFLIDWMNKRLKGNPNKMQVYSRYQMGGETLDLVIQRQPEREIEILKQLPANIFNDITAEVNQVVGVEEQTGVETFSESVGEFAEATKQFSKAKQYAKASLDKLKSFVLKKREEAPPEEPPPAVAEPEPVAPPPPPPKPEFQFFKVKAKEIDFPYFLKETQYYPQKLSLIRVKLGAERYKNLVNTVNKTFNNMSESAFIRRRTPKHEWIMPYVIKENIGSKTIHHLLVIGAEVKAKQLSMGYRSGASESAHQFTPFLIYGNDQADDTLGEATDTRIARGVTFNEYACGDPRVLIRAWDFFEKVATDQKFIRE